MLKEEKINQNQAKLDKLITELTLFDDDLMAKVFDDNISATELILKIILKREDIQVISVVGQKELENPIVEGRNIILDILVKNCQGEYYNIEVQRAKAGAHERRARFHSSMLDVRMLRKNQKFKELLDSYVIFIVEQDYFHMGLPMYTIQRHVNEVNQIFLDGSNIIYLNGEYEGNDDIGKMIHDFKCKETTEFYYQELADGVEHFREREGKKIMCEAVEQYAKDVAIQTVIETSLEFGVEKERIIQKLCEKFEVSSETAEKWFEEVANN